MKIKKAITLGFRKFEDGEWRRPIKQFRQDGTIRKTWQHYLLKQCIKCKGDYLASHETMTYCSSDCQEHFGGNPGWRLDKKFPNERGGVGRKRIASNGYIEIHLPGHPLADTHGRVLEHRLIIYEEIKRPLTFHDIVHHINGKRTDNRRENLILLTRGDHNSHHKTEEVKHRIRSKIGRFT